MSEDYFIIIIIIIISPEFISVGAMVELPAACCELLQLTMER